MASGDVRGGEFYEDPVVRDAYLEHRHDGVRSPNTVMEEPAFLAATGRVAGKRVLDLGCGDGSTAALMLAAGAASYVGIDGSAGMIDDARSRNDVAGASFIHVDIEDAMFTDGEFDLVVSRMAVHYIEHLESVLTSVHRVLPVGGNLVFSVVHPAITSHDAGGPGPRTSWTLDNYFERGPRERAWFGSAVTWHHRTIEDYVSLLLSAGFQIDGLSECEPDAELLAADPHELARRRRVPLMLLLRCTRT